MKTVRVPTSLGLVWTIDLPVANPVRFRVGEELPIDLGMGADNPVLSVYPYKGNETRRNLGKNLYVSIRAAQSVRIRFIHGR